MSASSSLVLYIVMIKWNDSSHVTLALGKYNYLQLFTLNIVKYNFHQSFVHLGQQVFDNLYGTSSHIRMYLHEYILLFV
jgi:hypothetical protein